MEDMYVYEIIVIGVVCSLLIYLLATKDDNWVPMRERPTETKSKKSVINYHAWRGPMFIEDFTTEGFTNFTTEGFNNFTTDNPNEENVPVLHTITEKTHSLSDIQDQYLGDIAGLELRNDPNRTKQLEKKLKCHRKAMGECRTDTLTAEEDWRNEHWNSPYWMRGPSDKGDLCHAPDWRKNDPGNFKQATNNNLDAPNNLTCQARSIMKDYCDPVDKVSPHCYKKTFDHCYFA